MNKKQWTVRISRLNDFMRRNLVWILILVTIYFAFVAADSSKANETMNTKQTETLTKQNRLLQAQNERIQQQTQEIRDLQKLGICLMEAHGVPLPHGVENDIDCQEIAESFNSSTPNDSSLSRSNNDSVSEPENQNPNGGGEEEDPPIEILGVPICVPLTQTCLR